MLIFAVFLRPSTMIIGFIFATIFATLLFPMFNTMMFYAMQTFISSTIINSSSMTAAIIVMLLLFLYCYAVLSFITQCFSLIYVVPNKIMRWIGVPVDEADEEQWLEEIKGGATEAMKGISNSSTATGGSVASSGLADTGARKTIKNMN